MIQEIVKVFILIFVAEVGDKTQILAMAFATKYPVKKVLLGIFIGAFLNHGIAVALGAAISDIFPLSAIKIVAAVVFMVFGIIKLFNSVPDDYLTPFNITLFIISLSLALFFLIKNMLKKEAGNKESAFKRQAVELHEFYQEIDEALEDICLGEKHCKKCLGNRCVIGCTKSLSKMGLNDLSGNFYPVSSGKFKTEGKVFGRKKLLKTSA
ncbi:MAG: TMEM165/GDT1 family protein [Thermotogota bacterium]|nr:TMEM165/GDT1 family protein [Thermotogota bacterium]